MKRLAVFIVLGVVGTLGLGSAPVLAQAVPDAPTVARSLIAAENAHDVSKAVSFFAPGAIVVLPTGQFTTTAEIRQWQTELAAGNFRADIGPVTAVTPEVVTFSGTVALDTFRQLGLASLASNWQLTIQGGSVTTFVFNFTPDATARLGAAIAAASAPAAGGGGAAARPATATPASLAFTGFDRRRGLAIVALGALAIAFGAVLVTASPRRRAVPRPMP